MKVALWPLSMNVVSANAARPSGAGSATTRGAGAARVSSITAITVLLPSWLRARGGASPRAPRADPYPSRSEICASNSKALRREVVRILRDQFAAVLRDDDDVLEPHAAEALPVETGLE